MQNAKLIATRAVHRGHVIAVDVDTVELPNGRVIDLDQVHHPGAAAVVPVDDAGHVHLVRQVRHATGAWLVEIPAGKLEPSEDPAVCARRELAEEVGLFCRDLLPMGFIYTTPGFCDERIWLYLARGLTTTAPHLDADEVLTAFTMPFREAVAQAEQGTLTDGKTVCALLRARALLPGLSGTPR